MIDYGQTRPRTVLPSFLNEKNKLERGCGKVKLSKWPFAFWSIGDKITIKKAIGNNETGEFTQNFIRLLADIKSS